MTDINRMSKAIYLAGSPGDRTEKIDYKSVTT